MNHLDYIENFKAFAGKAIEEHKPLADQSLTLGTAVRLLSYMQDLKQKMQALDKVLTDELNSLLKEIRMDSSIDSSELEEALVALAKGSFQTFISKYKPG